MVDFAFLESNKSISRKFWAIECYEISTLLKELFVVFFFSFTFFFTFSGYPNVGKSSTINRFLTSKKLQVSATPGKTKHFQTHLIGGSCIFIDGPGLVIPNLSMTRASMVLEGILQIDTLSEYLTSVDLLLQKIPFAHLLSHYGIMKSCVIKGKFSSTLKVNFQLVHPFFKKNLLF